MGIYWSSVLGYLTFAKARTYDVSAQIECLEFWNQQLRLGPGFCCESDVNSPCWSDKYTWDTCCRGLLPRETLSEDSLWHELAKRFQTDVGPATKYVHKYERPKCFSIFPKSCQSGWWAPAFQKWRNFHFFNETNRPEEYIYYWEKWYECPIGFTLLWITNTFLEHQYTTIAEVFSGLLYNILSCFVHFSAEAFQRFGISPAELLYFVSIVHDEMLPIQIATENDSPLVIDVGASRGRDSWYYLGQGYRVVAVEANPYSVAILRMRLWDFLVTDIRDLSSTRFLPQMDYDPDSCHTTVGMRVPVVNCFDILLVHGRPLYMKVDIEALTMPCIEALLLNGDENSLPHYLSFELKEWKSITSGVYKEQRFWKTLQAKGYTGFKLVGQVLYNPYSLLGDGGSGPFGELATDAKVGQIWRTLEDVMDDAADLLKRGEFWDLHCKLSPQSSSTWRF